MSAIYILWLRELKRYTRSRAQIIASLGQPMLYLLVLGFGLGNVFQRAGYGSYFQFIAPGVIGMSVLFSSIFSGLGLLWDRQFGFLKETLVAPVPRIEIMIGRTLGGSTVAVIQGSLVMVICLIAGFRPASWIAVPMAFGFMVLIAVLFAALGVAIGSSLQDMQGFQLIMNFLVMPIYFLSGAMFPLTNQGKILTFVTALDPLSYGIDGMRSVLLGKKAFSVLTDLLVLVVFYWSIESPRAGGLTLAFMSGLALDVINGVVLGQHALALTLMAAWATHLRLRLRVFSLLSQSLTIFALLTGYQFILFWIDGATGNPVTSFARWFAPVVGAIIWPLLAGALGRLNER